MVKAPQRSHRDIGVAFCAAVMLCAGCLGPRGGPIAQFPPAPDYSSDHEYTLDELVELSVHRNPSLDVSRHVAEAAEGLVDQVKTLWLPSIRYDFAATWYGRDIDYNLKALQVVPVTVPLTGRYNFVNNFSLAEIVYTGGKRTSGLKQAKMLAALSRIDVLRQQDAVACCVATFYHTVCLLNEIDAILDDAIRRTRVFHQVAEGLNERGSLRASNLDTLQAELLILQLEQLQILAQGSRQQAYAALKQAVGLLPAEPLLIRQPTLPPLVTPAERLSVAKAIMQGFLKRPETREADLFARIGEEQVRFAKAGFAPNIAVLADQIDVTGGGNSILGAIDGFVAGIIIDVPIYSPIARARLRSALGLEQAALALQRQLEQLIILDIEAAAREAQKTLALVGRSAGMVALANEHFDAAKQAFSRELVPASDVVIALALRAAAEVEHRTLLFAYHVARANLKRATADRETRYGY